MKKIIGFIGIILLLFAGCQKGLTEKDKNVYIVKGKEIAQNTAEHLGGKLTKAMKEGGVVKAVPFCNTMAMPLTDEMSEKHNTIIKRTAYKVRNKNNEPNSEESRVLNEYKNLLEGNKKIMPIVELDESGNPHF